MEQNNYPYEVPSAQMSSQSNIHHERHVEATANATTVRAQLPTDLQYAMDLAQEKRASSWLTTLLILEHKFTLHKGAFQYALALHYCWQPIHVPNKHACGTLSHLTMHSPVQNEVSPSFDIMR